MISIHYIKDEIIDLIPYMNDVINALLNVAKSIFTHLISSHNTRYSHNCTFNTAVISLWRKEGNVLFNDELNTFYLPLGLYVVGHVVKDHSAGDMFLIQFIIYTKPYDHTSEQFGVFFNFYRILLVTGEHDSFSDTRIIPYMLWSGT